MWKCIFLISGDLYSVSVLQKLSYLKVIKQLKKINREFNPDIIHAHYATSYGLLGTFLNHKSFLISVWGTDVYSFPKQSWLKKQILKYNLRKAKAIFSTSPDMAKETALYTKKQIHVVAFGIDIEKFKPIEKEESSRITIGIIKTLEDVYGVNFLIDAFAIIEKKKKYDVELLIVGKGNKMPILQNQVKALGLKHVKFVGQIRHELVPEYFSKMDIVVIPSLQESFGVAAVEASACQKPIVVSNVGGLPDVVIEMKIKLDLFVNRKM